MIKLPGTGKGRKRNNSQYQAKLSVKGMPNIRFVPDKRLLTAMKADPECVKEIRIVRTALRVEIQLVVNMLANPQTPSLHPVRKVGLDYGVNTRVMTSNGDRAPNIERGHKKRARVQRAMARTKPKPFQPSSANYKKNKQKHAKLCAREAEQARQATHRFTSKLTDNNDAIAVEDLKITNMTVKGKGKRGLNRSILQQSWAQITNQLEYKAENAACWFTKVPPAYTSRDCSQCGHRKEKLRLSERVFSCECCGLVIDRDLNAAINVRDRADRQVWQVAGGVFPVVSHAPTNNVSAANSRQAGGLTGCKTSDSASAHAALVPSGAGSSRSASHNGINQFGNNNQPAVVNSTI